MPTESKRCAMSLPCVLTDTDVLVRARDLGEQLREVERLEEEKKEEAALYGERLKAARETAKALREAVLTRRENRPVECEEERDYADKIVRVRRLDTGEVVEVRAMSQDEFQVSLAFPRHDEETRPS